MKFQATLKKLSAEFKLNESEGGSNSNVPNAADEEAVLNKLDRSVKFDEIDTITFGLETDDGKIVKVYVNAEQAEEFEKALATKLGEIDDIEEVLNALSKEYEIVDVEWPEDKEGADATSQEDEEDGSGSLDQKVYGPKRGPATVEDNADDSQFESLTMGEELTMSLMESTSSIESRFTTASQLMVYHAILDLGIPEIALARNPYRAAIVKGIKDTAADVQKSASLKIALKTFIRRAVDFDKKAAENEAEEKENVKESVQSAEQEGIAAKKAGKKSSDCPYGEEGSWDEKHSRTAWLKGYNSSQDKRVAFAGSQSKPSLQGAGNKGVKEEMKINEEKIDWSFSSDKENLTISCKALSFELGSEETEKLIKGVNNRDAVVVRDVTETPTKKVIFSPRGSTILVKQIGSQEGYMMTSKDVEDLIAAATPKEREKVKDEEVVESQKPFGTVVKTYPNNIEVRVEEDRGGIAFSHKVPTGGRKSWYVFKDNRNVSGAMTSESAAKEKAEKLSKVTESDDADTRNEIIRNALIAKVVKGTGLKSISVDVFLFGGGPGLSKAENKKLEDMGYDEGATTYEENKDFWKKCGITKAELKLIADESL